MKKNLPIFIVSGSVILPSARPRGIKQGVDYAASDDWVLYPRDLQFLFGLLAKNKVGNVVLLSGDLHFSMAAEIRRSTAGSETKENAAVSEPIAYSLVCSPIYAPMPFANSSPNQHGRAGDKWWPCGGLEPLSLEYRIDYASTGNSLTHVYLTRDEEDRTATLTACVTNGSKAVFKMKL